MLSVVYLFAGNSLHRQSAHTKTVVAVGQVRGSVRRIEAILDRSFRTTTEPARRGFSGDSTPSGHTDSCRTEPNPGPRAFFPGSERGSSPRGSNLSSNPNEIATTHGARPFSSDVTATPGPVGGGTLTIGRRPK